MNDACNRAFIRHPRNCDVMTGDVAALPRTAGYFALHAPATCSPFCPRIRIRRICPTVNPQIMHITSTTRDLTDRRKLDKLLTKHDRYSWNRY